MLLTEEDSSTSLEQSLLNDPEFDLGFYFSDDQDSDEENIRDELASAAAVAAGADQSSSSEAIDILSEQLEASLEDMIQTAQMHPRSLQVRQQHSIMFCIFLSIFFHLGLFVCFSFLVFCCLTLVTSAKVAFRP